jgi:hypothetical protein
MKLIACDCRAAHYQRVKRSAWMKVLPARRLFHCHACDQMLLLDPAYVQTRVRSEKTPESRALQHGDMALRA